MLRQCVLLVGLMTSACTAHTAPAERSPAQESHTAAARALFDQGSKYAREGDSVRAEQYLASALREGYDPEVALPMLMRVCLVDSRLRAALNHATPHLKQHPEAVWLRYLVATVYIGLRQPFRAREHLLTIEAQAPEHARAQYLLGLTEWEAFGDRQAAEKHFRAYLRLEPGGQYARETDEWLRSHAAGPAASQGPGALTKVPASDVVVSPGSDGSPPDGGASAAKPEPQTGLAEAPQDSVPPESRKPSQ